MKKLLIVSSMLLGACATPPDKIASSYVSPMEYSDYNCKQLGMEMTSISRRVTQLHGTLDKEASNDAAQMGVGLILFWPTLFFLEGGDGPQAAEYAELKGRKEALETAAIQKECDGLKFEEIKSPEVQKAPEKKELNG